MATPAEQVHALLLDRDLTVATAESLTGGRLASLLTQNPGASATYLGGVVSYATSLKQDVLGVPASLIEEHGVVSAECAEAMARGVRDLTGATYGISTTGVAGPDSQDSKAPGTVYVAVAGPVGDTTVSLELSGDRASVQERTCEEALSALAGIIRGEETVLG
jgi:PncC family amidohydrolase